MKPWHPCLTMTEGKVRCMSGGSPLQNPAGTQEQLALLRITHMGCKDSKFLPKDTHCPEADLNWFQGDVNLKP